MSQKNTWDCASNTVIFPVFMKHASVLQAVKYIRHAVCTKWLTLRAAATSGLSSAPMENVWTGYGSCSSLASFTSVAATRLESRPPVKKNNVQGECRNKKLSE